MHCVSCSLRRVERSQEAASTAEGGSRTCGVGTGVGVEG